MKLGIKKQRGFSLFLTVVFMAIMLSIVIGLNAILFGQLRALSQAGNSVVAFYAADTGAELILTTIITGPGGPPKTVPPTALDNGATYEIETRCCSQSLTNPDCIYDGATPNTTCPVTPIDDPTRIDTACQGRMFCSTVVGTFNKTQRTIKLIFIGG